MTTTRITIDLPHSSSDTAATWAWTIAQMLIASDRVHTIRHEEIEDPTAGALTPDPDKGEGPWEVRELRPGSAFYVVRHKDTDAVYGTGEVMTLSQATKAARQLNFFPCTAGTCSHKHPMP